MKIIIYRLLYRLNLCIQEMTINFKNIVSSGIIGECFDTEIISNYIIFSLISEH